MTRAMEAVSAVKMRRSVGVAVSSRPYALAAIHLLAKIRSGMSFDDASLSPLFAVRKTTHTTLVVVTSDKGLAGSFNATVLRKAERYIAAASTPISVFAIGKKARDYFRRANILEHAWTGVGDFGALEETKPMAEKLITHFLSGKTDNVVVIYANFISALRQEIVTRELLPMTVEAVHSFINDIIPERGKYANIPSVLDEVSDSEALTLTMEPSPKLLLDRLLPALLEIELYQVILEANASEHSARMLAMKSASENADELAGALTLQYNKIRQAHITKELAEITAGKEAQNL